MAQMTKWQKAVLESQLKSEQEAVDAIKKSYQQALKDIKAKIKELSADELTQSKVYQIEYQKALQGQISSIIDDMQSQQYETISAYLKGCYEGGYVGAMYGIKGQGIPIIVPIDQEQVARAVVTDSKLSKDLYSSMGKYLNPLKKAVTQEISRGMAAGEHWNDIAARIEQRTSIGWSNAIRIARTEGHRIQNAAKMDAMEKAKESGADVVKQWDSTMDGNTRKSHRKLDGQIREMDDMFEVNGHKAKSPGHFGRPEEDINCRCAILERARWALDDDELETLKQKEEFWGLDNSKSFDDFKAKYKEASSNDAKIKELSKKIEDAKKDISKLSKLMLSGKSTQNIINDYYDAMASLKSATKELESVMGKAAKASTYAKKKKAPAKKKAVESVPKAPAKKKETTVDAREIQSKIIEYKKLLPKYAELSENGETEAIKKFYTNNYNSTLKAIEDLKSKLEEQGSTAKRTVTQLTGFKRFETAQDADSHYRSLTKKQWATMKHDERTALYKYTGKSFIPMNSSLRAGNYRKGETPNDRLIDRATSAIDKCEVDTDVVARRGVRWSAAAKMLGIPEDSAKKSVLDALIGKTVEDKGFMSCGAAMDSGFFSGVTLTLYLPKGTKAVYAEPFSRYGGTSPSKLWDGKEEAHGVGDECELLLQRGSQFTVQAIDTDANGYVTNITLLLTGQVY